MEHYWNTLADVSPFAVVLSAVAMMIVGSLWYSSFFFGKAWMRLSGIRMSDIRPDEARRGYVFATIFALLIAYLLGVVAAHAGSNTHALYGGVSLIWLFVMAEQANGFVWEKQPFALFLLQAFRSLFSLLAGATVFLFWS
ncbi:MAG: DUF1761 domain-containing protein [Alphaproteobacteria bacterium]|nr:DUF1761 domain-containing protein [Alphaproteobacteria bacterium]